MCAPWPRHCRLKSLVSHPKTHPEMRLFFLGGLWGSPLSLPGNWNISDISDLTVLTLCAVFPVFSNHKCKQLVADQINSPDNNLDSRGFIDTEVIGKDIAGLNHDSVWLSGIRFHISELGIGFTWIILKFLWVREKEGEVERLHHTTSY